MRTKRSPFKPRAKTYKIENKNEESTVYIYDELGWFGLTSEQLVKDINAIDSKVLHLRFNSPGGSVFDGTAVFNAIKQHKSKTITHIDGLAASIASVIALASDEVRMAENAFLMIHDPWSIVIGNADVMREEADLLEKVGGVIAKTYMDKSGKDEKEIKELMNAETWMTAEEALEMGFIDAIDKNTDDEKARATMFDLSVFANVPETLSEMKATKKDLNQRDLEKSLRDAGYSRNQAKEIVAKVFQDEREAQTETIEQDEREAQIVDSEPPQVKKKDRTADLLTRAEMVAPSIGGFVNENNIAV